MTKRVCVPLAALLLTAAACNYEKVHKQPTIEESPRLASSVHMGDPTAAASSSAAKPSRDRKGANARHTQLNLRFVINLRFSQLPRDNCKT